MVICLFGWLVALSVGWLVFCLFVCLVGWLGYLVGLLVVWLVIWLVVGLLFGLLVGRSVGRSVGLFSVSLNICQSDDLFIQTVPFLCQVVPPKPSAKFQLLLN